MSFGIKSLDSLRDEEILRAGTIASLILWSKAASPEGSEDLTFLAQRRHFPEDVRKSMEHSLQKLCEQGLGFAEFERISEVQISQKGCLFNFSL